MTLSIIPQPRNVTETDDIFTLKSQARIVFQGDAARPAAELLAEYLRPATGFALPIVESSAQTGDLVLKVTGANTADNCGFYDESHQLSVNADKVELSGASTAALVRGLQTLRQLLPVEVYASTPQEVSWTIPGCLIEDSPTVRWRGVMIDVSRHFFPVAQVCRMIELAAQLKLSVVHLHLTDDQGWRLEIKKYPKLTEVGSVRKRTIIGHYWDKPWKYDETPYGGFFTQEDIKTIVAFAAKRCIMVVPEIDMPGHMVAAIASYPELGNYPQHQLEVRDCWGISYNILSPKPETIAFMKDVLAEVVELFPAKFIDIGGDEALKYEWEICKEVQEVMRAQGVKKESELQHYFTNEMGNFLASKGRRTIGWDDILNPEMPADAAVMNWHGADIIKEAARLNRKVVLTPHEFTYFDYFQADPKHEPLGIGGDLPLEKVYRFEPLDNSYTDAEKATILGAQAQLWAEYIPTAEHQEYMAFPRLCALAEKTWLCGTTPGYADFHKRLANYYGIFAQQKVNARPLE